MGNNICIEMKSFGISALIAVSTVRGHWDNLVHHDTPHHEDAYIAHHMADHFNSAESADNKMKGYELQKFGDPDWSKI